MRMKIKNQIKNNVMKKLEKNYYRNQTIDI